MEDPSKTALSRTAIEALRAELDELRTEGRTKLARRLLEAREHGDVSDNAEFESAKQEQSLLEGRIAKLEDLLRNAVVREVPADASTVTPGVVVTVRDADDPDLEDSYLVAESEERVIGVRVLSPGSPLGQALLGKRVGDKVTYQAPGGTFTYEVIALRPHAG
jgi:transcription elongation factor GreA